MGGRDGEKGRDRKGVRERERERERGREGGKDKFMLIHVSIVYTC